MRIYKFILIGMLVMIIIAILSMIAGALISIIMLKAVQASLHTATHTGSYCAIAIFIATVLYLVYKIKRKVVDQEIETMLTL